MYCCGQERAERTRKGGARVRQPRGTHGVRCEGGTHGSDESRRLCRALKEFDNIDCGQEGRVSQLHGVRRGGAKNERCSALVAAAPSIVKAPHSTASSVPGQIDFTMTRGERGAPPLMGNRYRGGTTRSKRFCGIWAIAKPAVKQAMTLSVQQGQLWLLVRKGSSAASLVVLVAVHPQVLLGGPSESQHPVSTRHAPRRNAPASQTHCGSTQSKSGTVSERQRRDEPERKQGQTRR